jgi:uncharacterized protein (TIGR02391 family)
MSGVGSAQDPPVQVKVFTSPDELEESIAKVRHRFQEVVALAPTGARFDAPCVERVMDGVADTLLEVFGPRSLECRQHRLTACGSRPGETIGNDRQPHDPAEAIPHTARLLKSILERLEENRADFLEAPEAPPEGFLGVDLHPRIAQACEGFLQGRYVEAVTGAAAALESLVRQRSGCRSEGGPALMARVFSPRDPLLAFNDLSDETDQEEQRGWMLLFEGASLALGRWRALGRAEAVPAEAADAIRLIGLLADHVERARWRDAAPR